MKGRERMKLNLKVRLKNPVFWLTVIPALLAFVYSVLGAFDVVPTLSEDMAVKILTSIVTALAALGVLVDPTTSGLSDSSRALNYTEPAKSEAEVISDDING